MLDGALEEPPKPKASQNMEYIKQRVEQSGNRFDASDFTGKKKDFDNILGKNIRRLFRILQKPNY